MLLQTFWGSPSHVGSLCNLREIIRRVQVDKTAKIFSVCDEFVLHAYRSHLLGAICTQLDVESPDAALQHEPTLEWLRRTAESIVTNTLYPKYFEDTTYNFHRCFLHTAFLYADLRNAVRYEHGQHIIRHWKWWIPRFLGSGFKNYASEAAKLIVNVTARFPKHIAYIAINNRTVNMDGRVGHGKPIDQAMEHYNLYV